MLPEFELEFEPEQAHFILSKFTQQVIEMLYQNRVLGHSRIGARLAARLAIMLGSKRYADLDLLSMNPHLRRDIGIDSCGTLFLEGDIWRK